MQREEEHGVEQGGEGVGGGGGHAKKVVDVLVDVDYVLYVYNGG